jgi:hypothetical protein
MKIGRILQMSWLMDAEFIQKNSCLHLTDGDQRAANALIESSRGVFRNAGHPDESLRLRVTAAQDNRRLDSPRQGTLFTCAAASRTVIDLKNMATARMSSPLGAIICRLSIQLIAGT